MVEANRAEDVLVEALHKSLGRHLHTIYRVPALGEDYFLPERQQPVRVVVVDEVKLHEVRRAFLPVWRQHSTALGEPPLVVQRVAWQRHLHLFPLFGRHLARTATRLFGPDTALPLAEPDPEEWVAFLARQTMLASAVLADIFLAPEQLAAAQRRLDQVARTFDLEVPEGELMGERFRRVQEALEPLMQTQLPEKPDPAGNAGSFGPAVVAVYKEQKHLVLVTERSPRDLLGDLDWSTIGRRMKMGTVMQLTTAPQLKLIVSRDRPLDLLLHQFDHLHGADLLHDVEPAEAMVFHQAARTPSTILVKEMPTAYLAAEEQESVHQIIHDFQNRLLNLHLRHELLHRLHGLAPVRPPLPLPERDAPLDERVEGIVDQLHWWAGHYAAALP